MSEKYVKFIYEVYLYYQIKNCGHLTCLSFTQGVTDTLISNKCHFAIGWNNQGNVTLSFDENVLIFIKVSSFQTYF